MSIVKSELEAEHSVRVLIIPKDLTAPSAAKEIFETIKSEGIELEFLINNAGFGGQGLFHERDWRQELSQIQLNIVALTELCHLFLPEFVKRNRGRILNVASTAALPPGGPLHFLLGCLMDYAVNRLWNR